MIEIRNPFNSVILQVNAIIAASIETEWIAVNPLEAFKDSMIVKVGHPQNSSLLQLWLRVTPRSNNCCSLHYRGTEWHNLTLHDRFIERPIMSKTPTFVWILKLNNNSILDAYTKVRKTKILTIQQFKETK